MYLLTAWFPFIRSIIEAKIIVLFYIRNIKNRFALRKRSKHISSILSHSFHTKEAEIRKEKKKKLWWPSILACLHNTDTQELKDTDGLSQDNNSMEVDQTFKVEPFCVPTAARDSIPVEKTTSHM